MSEQYNQRYIQCHLFEGYLPHWMYCGLYCAPTPGVGEQYNPRYIQWGRWPSNYASLYARPGWSNLSWPLRRRHRCTSLHMVGS